MTDHVHIDLLANHVYLVPTVGRWFFEEWSYLNPDGSLQDAIQRARARALPEGIPTLFIGLDGDVPVGCCGLKAYDTSVDDSIRRAHLADVEKGLRNTSELETRQIPTPWLVSVYVVPEYRRRGIASRLVRHGMHSAKRQGVEKLYLYTDTEAAEALYLSLGWKILERMVYSNFYTNIMVANLAKEPT